MRDRSLRERLSLLLVQWMVVYLAVSGLIGVLALRHFRAHVEQDRLLLARTVAHSLSATVMGTLRSASRLTAELPSLDEAAVPQLRSFRFQSLFRDAIHILDAKGRPVISDPPFARLPVIDWDHFETRVGVTGLIPSGAAPDSRPVLAMVVPFERGGKAYYLVGEMKPRGSTLSIYLQNLAAEPDFHVVVIDASSRVIAAPDHEQLFRDVAPGPELGERVLARRPLVARTSTCTICLDAPRKGTFLTVMVPLRIAPWGVVIQQDQGAAFAVLRPSQAGLLASLLLVAVMGLLLSRGLVRSVVEPIQQLSAQAEQLRQGDLETPVAVEGDREIQVLANTLNEARSQIATVLGELTSVNLHLEELVADRTRVLRSRFEDLKLLHDVSALAAREREPERFLPEVLRLVSRRYSFHAVALVTTSTDGPRRRYVYPEEVSLPWLEEGEGAEPAPGWQRRDLVHHGESQGALFYRWPGDEEQPVMDALQHELALSLHGASMLRRVLVQDAQRKVLVRRLLAAGEEERRRIARELHDEISQLLTVIQLSLEPVAEQAGGKLDRVKELLSTTQKEIHRIIYDLRPSLLDDLGLAAAVKWYASSYLEPAGLQVSLEVEDDLELPAEVEITTFRIYQEIITNILRHARAERVSIELYARGGRLVLAVEDDGVGFDPEERVEGAGLLGMRERASLVGGRLDFDSEPGMGAHVALEIPLDLESVGEAGAATGSEPGSEKAPTEPALTTSTGGEA